MSSYYPSGGETANLATNNNQSHVTHLTQPHTLHQAHRTRLNEDDPHNFMPIDMDEGSVRHLNGHNHYTGGSIESYHHYPNNIFGTDHQMQDSLMNSSVASNGPGVEMMLTNSAQSGLPRSDQSQMASTLQHNHPTVGHAATMFSNSANNNQQLQSNVNLYLFAYNPFVNNDFTFYQAGTIIVYWNHFDSTAQSST